VQTYVGPATWLSAFDLNNLSAGAAAEFDRIGSDTIQRINAEFVTRRIQFQKSHLRFRHSGGRKRSLGWIPFKGVSLVLRAVEPKVVINKRGIRTVQHQDGYRLTFGGKTIRLHQMERLVEAWRFAEKSAAESERARAQGIAHEQEMLASGIWEEVETKNSTSDMAAAGPTKKAPYSRKPRKLRDCTTGKTFSATRTTTFRPALGSGSFAQNALGEWFLNVTVTVPYEEGTTFDEKGNPYQPIAPKELVGLDPGLKYLITTSDGVHYGPNRSYRELEEKIANLQRHGHKKQAKRVLAKAKNQRLNLTHQISSALVAQYQIIKIGDVPLEFLMSGNRAKSALDSGLGMLKAQLHYKGRWAGRSVLEVDECNTTRTCSCCKALTGPTGQDMLVVRFWTCSACGAHHDRDVNAAINVARAQERKAAKSPKALQQKSESRPGVGVRSRE
jgi:hypothetical protein